MSRNRRRSRIQFQPQFLVGALGALSLAAGGCGALISDGPGGTDSPTDSSTDDSNDAQGGDSCPAEVPANGAPCTAEQEGMSCGVLVSCSAERHVSCSADGHWVESYISCNPPPPELTVCPRDEPVPGTYCFEYATGLSCGVNDPCGNTRSVVCSEDNIWTDLSSTCNPPFIGTGGGMGMGGAPGMGGANSVDESTP